MGATPTVKKVCRVAYFCVSIPLYGYMSVCCDCEDARVTETAWERLYRLVELRRVKLDLTLSGLQVVGGPSPKWVQKLRMMSGPPTPRMRASMRDLDRALQWKDGTSWNLVDVDRSEWSAALLEDEENDLVNKGPDEADNFGYVVAARLRAIPAGPDRDLAMLRILDILSIEP